MGLRILRGAGLAALLVVVLALPACSSAPAGSETAAQLVPALQAAAAEATSVHVAGSLKQGTQATTIDVSISGDSVVGYLGAHGTHYYVLSLNGNSFVKLNAAFLQLENAPASLCAKICGKYVQLSTSGTMQITELLSMQQIVREVFNNQDMSAAASSGCIFSPATLNGQSVLQCRHGDANLAVAAHGPPYLVYWSGPHGQHLAFSEWNSVVLPPAPPASQVVSLSSLS
jgi:hypothetical protein